MSGEAAADGHARVSEVAAMVGEFRRRLVLVPLHDDGGLMSAELSGLRWIYAFTSRETLAAFALGRGAGGEWDFQALYGARLLDEVIPSLDFWCGVAVDAGSEGGQLLPPVRGIVPERAAVDAAAETAADTRSADTRSAATRTGAEPTGERPTGDGPTAPARRAVEEAAEA